MKGCKFATLNAISMHVCLSLELFVQQYLYLRHGLNSGANTKHDNVRDDIDDITTIQGYAVVSCLIS